MGRHVNSEARAFGVSNSLRSQKFPRSKEVSKSRKDHRMSAGYQAVQHDPDSVLVKHNLGSGHRITLAADRAARVEAELTAYAEALTPAYAVQRYGEGEQAYLLVRNPVHPAVGETLRKAAKLIRELPGSAAKTTNAAIIAEHLENWAVLAESNKDW